MGPKFLRVVVVVLALFGASLSVHGQSVYVSESADHIRLQQYTGNPGGIYFWRLPAPSAFFPGSSCHWLSIYPGLPEQASRFIALYLFAKTNAKDIFYYFDQSTCAITSFGMDG